MLDLYHASRDDLIRIILSQRDALADRDRQLAAVRGDQAALSQVVKELTVQIGELRAVAAQDPGPPRATPPGMPGLKATEPVARTAPDKGDGSRADQCEARDQLRNPEAPKRLPGVRNDIGDQNPGLL